MAATEKAQPRQVKTWHHHCAPSTTAPTKLTEGRPRFWAATRPSEQPPLASPSSRRARHLPPLVASSRVSSVPRYELPLQTRGFWRRAHFPAWRTGETVLQHDLPGWKHVGVIPTAALVSKRFRRTTRCRRKKNETLVKAAEIDQRVWKPGANRRVGRAAVNIIW